MAYYITTNVTLKFGRNASYNDMMAQLAPYMERHGWKLLLALQPYVGDLAQIFHVWEVAEFDDVRRGLEACAADPEAHAILAPMPDLLVTEAMQLTVKTPYSP
ncbi:NIPSNAP family protein [Sphingomonas profundi]|uniref:NIPSNAP family protein n=1 Tax=Alterirhizorhabdus profundi TaxID=2681549 RepID=UPI0012E8887D|nr:NIPSNAP family protein [Sphingomonas profundi]